MYKLIISAFVVVGILFAIFGDFSEEMTFLLKYTSATIVSMSTYMSYYCYLVNQRLVSIKKI